MSDFTAPALDAAQRASIAQRISQAIDDYCQRSYDDGHRAHLGASEIGHPCSRYLWYKFRWCAKETFSGRMLRLFNRGHREEERFIEWLRGIGFTVEQHTEEGHQFRIAGVGGHYGGSLDGRASVPTWLAEVFSALPPRVLLEFKTSGTGSAFTKVKLEGVKIAKPRHYMQMCAYGRHYQLSHALYFIINKNDDDLHCEVVELDWSLGEQLEIKAAQIITASAPPPRLSENPSYFECAYCPMKGLCHGTQPYEKNCRSCRHATAAEGKQWVCGKYGTIPVHVIFTGCAEHEEAR